MKELVIKKCQKCDTTIRILKDCNCMDNSCCVTCCEGKMITLNPNSSDGAIEKHLPMYEKVGDDLIVKVSHVMDQDHFIEWISLVTPEKEEMVFFKPNDTAECKFKVVPNSILYAYCNKHGLWRQEVK